MGAIPYWMLFCIGVFAVLSKPLGYANTARNGWVWFWALLTLLIGFRFEVGGDWFNYVAHLDLVRELPLIEAIQLGDPAHQLFNWISVKMGWGVYGTNLAYGAIFSYGLIAFCRAQPMPWLAIAVAIPYLVIVVAMGYSRQSVAIGIAMLALNALADKNVRLFVIYLAIAALFHKTAVILIPMVVLANTQNRYWTALWVGAAGLLLFRLLLEEHTDTLWKNYVEAGYASSGGAIRVAMNALAAVLFLKYRKWFDLKEESLLLWTWMSIISLVLVLVFYVSPSSTAVDRVALYFIPLQLFVYSRLPIIFGERGQINLNTEIQIILFYAMVQFVWLSFATHSEYWVPYSFYWFSSAES